MDRNCTAMIELSSSVPLKTAIFLNLVICLGAIPLLVWSVLKLKILHLHDNTKMIMAAHLFGFLLHCSGRVVLHSLDLLNYTFREPCDMLPSIYRCFVFRLFYNTGLWITSCTVLPLLIERSIATYRNGCYEHSSKLIGVFCIILHIVLAAIPLSVVYSNTQFDNVFMPYCRVITPAYPMIANMNGIISTVIQLLCRVLFSVLFKLNKAWRQKSFESDLTTRFQLEQNINTMTLLKVFANLTTVVQTFHTGTFLLLLLTSKSLDLALETYIALMEMNSIFPLYAIVTVFLITKKIMAIRHRIRTVLHKHVTTDPSFYNLQFRKQIKSSSKRE